MPDHPRHRPPWWPEGAAFPPETWRRQRRFAGRMLFFAIGLIVLTIGACTITFWVAALNLGWLEFPGMAEGMPMPFPPRGVAPSLWATRVGGLIWFVAVGLIIVMVIRGARRLIGPISDVMLAAQRVEGGDYAVRVRERGPRDVRRLSRAFNAMASRLERNEQDRRRLLADVTHELRTPLTIAQGQLEGLLDGVYPRDDAHLSVALEETRVMARLIEDLRTLTLSEAGSLKLERESVDPGELIADVAAAFGAPAAQAGVRLSANAEPQLPALDADPTRLREVLSNLVSNALRYTPADGEISIRAARAGDSVSLSVSDTGRGIPDSDLPHIFDRFYKGADSRGTGLGLAIAKSLVEAHGGAITAESAPGRGTTMTVILPIAAG
ncbi:MAG TPA: HAMP domain-containing sensor histidine kinase [Thermoflexales bacterium]|nr:HAMP domain-containing sensor histidine kinase [Thermoflexales bacterium]HQX12511.1 HAMP domain-containing sensor histidine kinase [Thermoflexales bacterium]HQY26988.1 HAMP domain-containing sensor histidine kinase [Thermoflexales bacterium]HQZ53822.1 HAMP domain-containing sensor histidine kinase [Thermoflexales bacterium]HRA54282.1 HAMP domain-containing sensor histidine kinase [Thermoflexales bacterium]